MFFKRKGKEKRQTMGERVISSGGAAFSGYIYQTLYAILACMEDKKWDSIKIEPVSSKEQIDILLLDSNSLSGGKKYYKKIQVKKRKDSISESEIDKWIDKLKKDDSADNYEICLFGRVTDKTKHKIDRNVKIYENNITDIENKVRAAIADYCIELKAKDYSERDLDIAYYGLFNRLAKNSMEERTIGKEEINHELKDILKYSVDNCAANLKYMSWRRFYENPTFIRDLSPKRLAADGQTLVEPENLPRLSDNEFPKVLFYSSENRKEKEKKSNLFECFEEKAKDELSLSRHIYDVRVKTLRRETPFF